MTEGFVLDRSEGARAIASRVEGKPSMSFWIGVSLGGKEPIEIATWRRTRCGYLESCAPG